MKKIKLTTQEFNKWLVDNEVISYISMYNFNGGDKTTYRVISSMKEDIENTFIKIIK